MSLTSPAPVPLRLMQRRRPETMPVTPQSLALFRLGEICNDRCPMCSNSGREAAWLIGTDELLARADFLASEGFRRVVLTGGEPTIHPAFWQVVTRLEQRGIDWDINTHGRSFADPAFARRALAQGLRRAIVSLHGHTEELGRLMFGVPRAHGETVRGVEVLLGAGVDLTLNCVLSRANHRELAAYVDWCAERFGNAYTIKFVFPFRGGKGGQWEGIQLTYSEVLPGLAAARERAAARQIPLTFESFPNCVLGLRDHRNLSRSGFGETHYLEDLVGRTLYGMEHIEATVYGFPETPCRGCAARGQCAGVAFAYLRAHGASELTPFEGALTRQATYL